MRKAPNLHACHHLCYTLMMFMTPVIVIFYWVLVHKDHVEYIRHKYRFEPHKFEMAYFHTTYLVHTLPGLSALYLMITTDVVLIKRHALFLIAFGIMYSVSNYFSTHSRGMPLYWFLDWINNPMGAILVSCTALPAFVLVFVLTAIIDEKITGRSAVKNSKNKSK
jgi:hypothetical protein